MTHKRHLRSRWRLRRGTPAQRLQGIRCRKAQRSAQPVSPKRAAPASTSLCGPAAIAGRLGTFSDSAPSFLKVSKDHRKRLAPAPFLLVFLLHHGASCHLLCTGRIPLRYRRTHLIQCVQSCRGKFTARSKITSFTTFLLCRSSRVHTCLAQVAASCAPLCFSKFVRVAAIGVCPAVASIAIRGPRFFKSAQSPPLALLPHPSLNKHRRHDEVTVRQQVSR